VSQSTPSDSITANLAVVRARLAQAAARSARPASDVRLVAISKTFGPEHVRAAYAAGQRDFGENRVQEALEKRAALADLGDIRWHLVGHLQSNKARKVVGPFGLVHSVDSRDLLLRLDAVAREQGVTVDVLLQVDLAGEATKFGAPLEALAPLVDAAVACEGTRMAGLMLLPPWFDDPEEARPYFRRLRQIRDDLRARGVPASMLRELSMGMSHDFEVAIEEGATLVRVGTAIFGSRPSA
jgi:hypothetical protein